MRPTGGCYDQIEECNVAQNATLPHSAAVNNPADILMTPSSFCVGNDLL